MNPGDWVWIGKSSRSKYESYNIDTYEERYGRVSQVMVENVAVYVTPVLTVNFPKHQIRKV